MLLCESCLWKLHLVVVAVNDIVLAMQCTLARDMSAKPVQVSRRSLLGWPVLHMLSALVVHHALPLPAPTRLVLPHNHWQILDPNGLPSTVEEFAAALDESIPAWQQVGWGGHEALRLGSVCHARGHPDNASGHADNARRHPVKPPPNPFNQHGYRGIWLKVPSSRAHFVGHAVDRGFEFHHAEKVRELAACLRGLPCFLAHASTQACQEGAAGGLTTDPRLLWHE